MTQPTPINTEQTHAPNDKTNDKTRDPNQNVSYTKPSDTNQAFWQQRYQEQETPWNLDVVAPPFKHLISSYPAYFKGLNSMLPGVMPGKALGGKALKVLPMMAVLGCGYGHDAAYFGQAGAAVTAFDFADEAIAAAKNRYNNFATFIQADIFALPENQEFNAQFDYVLEHTCFCAIDPTKRKAYVETVHFLLKPGGTFVGLIFFDTGSESEEGPPYASTQQEIEALFMPQFTVQVLEIASHSVENRKNRELLCIFQKKPN
ncbi:MAG: methyltransferase domain-containing protein [Cyanobacteria bacterium P01_H01_bin.74]